MSGIGKVSEAKGYVELLSPHGLIDTSGLSYPISSESSIVESDGSWVCSAWPKVPVCPFGVACDSTVPRSLVSVAIDARFRFRPRLPVMFAKPSSLGSAFLGSKFYS